MQNTLFRFVVVASLFLILAACEDSTGVTDNEGTLEPASAPQQSMSPTPERADSGVATITPAMATESSTATPSIALTEASAPAIATSPPVAAPREPAQVAVAEGTISLPAGFTIGVFAEDLGTPRFMAYDEEGVLHATDRDGRVLRLPDEDGDGRADKAVPIVYNLDNPHGITFYQEKLYVAEQTRVVRTEDANSDGLYEVPIPVIEGLPRGGHWSRTIRFGPDGKLYVSIGSSCNVCIEEDALRAAIWRYNPDGSGGELFAKGLRNAVGIAFSPETGELWATNNGRDGMGDDVPPETLNRVKQGDDFGWPRCHSGDIPDPELGGEQGCAGVAQPGLKMQAHSAPLGLAFYDAEQFGDAYRGDLFVAFHGSWNRTIPTGYKVVHIPFADGEPTGEIHDFATGWLLESGEYWGRPVDVIVAPDGNLMVSDDFGGRIYRISREP